MGERGPIPARSEERRRTNSPQPTKLGVGQASAAGVDLDPTIPEAGEHWLEHVVALYDSLRTSPGVVFMYATDWHLAWQLCEQLNQNLEPQFVGFKDEFNVDADAMEHLPVHEIIPMKGATVSAILAGFRALGVTEEARRRMGFEAPPLQRAAERAAAPADADVVATRDELGAERARRRGLA